MLSRHSATKEIKHAWKFTSGFIGSKSSILREVSACPGTPKQSCPPCIISLGSPGLFIRSTHVGRLCEYGYGKEKELK